MALYTMATYTDDELYWGEDTLVSKLNELESGPAAAVLDKLPGRCGRVTEKDMRDAEVLEMLRRIIAEEAT